MDWLVRLLAYGAGRGMIALEDREKKQRKKRLQEERLIQQQERLLHEHNLKNDPEYRKAYERQQSLQKEETKKNLRELFLLLALLFGPIVIILYLHYGLGWSM